MNEPEVLPQVVLLVENPLLSISLTEEIVVVSLKISTSWVKKTVEYAYGF